MDAPVREIKRYIWNEIGYKQRIGDSEETPAVDTHLPPTSALCTWKHAALSNKSLVFGRAAEAFV